MNRSPDQIGVVLSGGGAYGAFSVGVLNTLFAGRSPATGYQPLQATIFSGTSVGSFNAAVMVAHPGNNLDASLYLEQVWADQIASSPGVRPNGVFRLRGDPTDYVGIGSVGQLLSQAAGDTFTFGKYAFWRTANFLASYSSSLDNRLLHLINIEDLIDTSPLTQLLDRVLDAAVVRNSAKKLRITTTDWVSGKALVFGNEDFVGEKGNRAVSASTAIPGIFPPVEIGCSLCVDGGVVQNTPLNPAIQLGATELHVIALNPEPQDVALSGEPNTIDTMMRVYFMLLAGKLNEDIETARWINQGLDVFDRAEKGGQIGDLEVTRVLRMVGHKGPLGKPLRKVVIHKYLPSTSLGGDLSMLNFDREQVIKMIQLGENEALTHDCEACRCVLD